MHLTCPHCQNAIELVTLPASGELLCALCGSTFRVEPEATVTLDGSTAHSTLGRFELLSVVGIGAFGRVYKARDPRLDRTVAVKVPRAANLPDGQDLDRFLREARSTAQLRHPAIVPTYEVGQENGTPYIVSDFVEGVTLADRLTTGELPFREVAKLVAIVADALDHAHRNGVVHRDVKPSNIMLRPDGTPVVMDFGLAKRAAGEITMTTDGQILGTPAYMSPEQARGEGHAVDGRSDVYSLGIILYRLLTHELPFRGNQRMLLHQVLNDDPKPLRSLNDKIPRDLETICLMAMAKEPARRYATARELGEDLHRYLAGEAIRGRPVSRPERLWRLCRRKPIVAGLGATLAALLLVVAITGPVVAIRESFLRREAEAAKADALHTALRGFHLTAESSLATARMLRTAPGEANPRPRALAALKTAGEARVHSRDALVALGRSAGTLVEEEPRDWTRREDDLRDEATWWLTRLDFGRVWEVPVAGDYMAVEETSRRIAVSVGDAIEIFDEKGQSVQIIPIEDQFLRSLLVRDFYSHGSKDRRFSFPDPSRLEFVIAADRYLLSQLGVALPAEAVKPDRPAGADTPTKVIFRWTLPAGRLTREPSPDPVLQTPPVPPERDVRGREYIAVIKQDNVAVRPSAGGDPLEVWKAPPQETPDFGRDREACKTALFVGTDPRALLIHVASASQSGISRMPATERLLLVDSSTGARRELTIESTLQSIGTGPRIEEVRSFGEGFLTLEKAADRSQMRTLQRPMRRLTFWSAILPSVRISGYPHEPLGPGDGSSARAISLADDGRLLSLGGGYGSGQQVLRHWDERKLSWSTARTGWNYHSATLEFDRSGARLFVARNDSEGRRLDVLDAKSGALVRSWPLLEAFTSFERTSGSVGEWSPGSILKRSHDGRFVVVIGSEVEAGRMALELWSLDDLRVVRSLGSFPDPKKSSWGTSLQFSPKSRWLFIASPGGSGQDVAFWRLDPLELVGTARCKESGEVGIDPEERDDAYIGNENFDLATASRRSELEPLAMSPGVEIKRAELSVSLRTTRWQIGFYKPDGFFGTKSQCVAWDIKTGKRTEIGEPQWSRDGLNKKSCLLEGDRLFVMGQVGPFGADEIVRCELWDLSNKTLIRRLDRKKNRASVGESPLPWADKQGIYLGPEPVGTDKRSTKRWSWADGREEDAKEGPAVIVQVMPEQRSTNSRAFRTGGRPPWTILKGTDALLLHAADDSPDLPLSDSLDAGASGQVDNMQARIDLAGKTLALSYRCAASGQEKSGPKWTEKAGLWDIASGRRLATIPGNRSILGFDKSGAWLITTESIARTTTHTDPRTGGEVQTTKSTTQGLILTDAQTGRDVHHPLFASLPGGHPSSPTIDPTGSRVAFVDRGTLYLWNAAEDRPVALYRGTEHSGAIQSIAQHAKAGIVASGDADGIIILRDRTDGHFLRMLDGHKDGVSAMAFDAGGTHLASASPRRFVQGDTPFPFGAPRGGPHGAGPTVIAWGLDRDQALWTYVDAKAGVSIDALAFASGGAHLFVGMSDGRILRLDAATGRPASNIEGDPSGFWSIEGSPDGRRFLALGRKGHLQIWNAQSLALIREWDVGPDVQSAAFLSDRLTITGGRAIRVLDAESGRTFLNYAIPDSPVRLVSAWPSHGQFVYAGQGSDVHRLDLRDLQRQLHDLNLAIPGTAP